MQQQLPPISALIRFLFKIFFTNNGVFMSTMFFIQFAIVLVCILIGAQVGGIGLGVLGGIGLATMANCDAMTAIVSGREGRMPLRWLTSAITGKTE